MPRILCFFIALTLTSSFSSAESYVYKREKAKLPQLAIIIDDIGYNIPLGKRTIALPGNITLAVLPLTPGSKMLAEEGFQAGKEIMLHAPMSNFQQRKLGPGALTEDMSKEEFIATLTASINSIPHIQGVNNHMGSKLTSMSKPMQWVMQTLVKHKLFFVDSLTNSHSVAYRTAKDYGLKTQRRDVFLDHEINESFISNALEKAIKKAKANGYAIAIGHPYPETLAVLERVLPTLKERDIELVHISKLINFKKQQQASNAQANSSHY